VRDQREMRQLRGRREKRGVYGERDCRTKRLPKTASEERANERGTMVRSGEWKEKKLSRGEHSWRLEGRGRFI